MILNRTQFLVLKRTLTSDTLQKLQSLPPHTYEGRDVKIRKHGEAVCALLRLFPDETWDTEAAKFRDAVLEQNEAFNKIREQKKLALGHTDFDFKTVPYRHQLHAFNLSRDLPEFALFMEQGTGKTKVILDTTSYLVQAKKINCLLIMAPSGVHRSWIDEQIPTHFDLPHQSWYNGQKAGLFAETLDSDLAVFAFNYDAVSGSTAGGRLSEGQRRVLAILQSRRCLWVLDESQRIKNTDANRTKFILKHREAAPYRRICTGTPVTRNVEDLYSQFLFLNPMILGYSTKIGFRTQYCVTRSIDVGPRKIETVVGSKNVEELKYKIEGCSFHIRKEDCLDLPPKIYLPNIPVDLTPTQKRLYKELQEECITEFENEMIAVEAAMVRLLRLQQIVCNWWPGEEGTRAIGSDNPRLTAMLDFLQDTDGKVIVWSRFRADLELFYERLGPKVAVPYWGGLGSKLYENKERFTADPDTLYLLANPQVGSTGLNLTVANTQVWYANSFDLEHRLQGEERNYRAGQTLPCTYVDLEAKGTVDTKILKALKGKMTLIELIRQEGGQIFK